MQKPAALPEDVFITATGPLTAADAVAAILVLDDGRYVMQLRDPLPGIFYPGHWGCFGGAVEPGEQPLEGLVRELQEELELEVASATEFTRFDFDLRRLGQKPVYRVYFEVTIASATFGKLVLHEGREVRAFTGADILKEARVTPYDAFAIWLHHRRERLRG